MLADVASTPLCSSTGGIGFASPLLYAVASNPHADASSFNDITTGNNDEYGLDGGATYPATKGYDMATGLGSPRLTGPKGGNGLAYYLCTAASSVTRPTIGGVSPSAGSVAGGDTVTITGSNFEVAGIPDVASVQFGSTTVPAGEIDVVSATELELTTPASVDASGSGARLAGGVPIEVTLHDGATSQPTPLARFQYVDESAGGATVPSVSGVGPIGGPMAGGGQVVVYGSGFRRTGADAVQSVTFGGKAAASVDVVSWSELEVTAPAYDAATNGGTSCAGAGPAGPLGECQVAVQVTNAAGTSATTAILRPADGNDLSLGYLPGCARGAAPTCEVRPQPAEYDYFPAPVISHVSLATSPDGRYGEVAAYQEVEVTGTGLDPGALESIDFTGGSPTGALLLEADGSVAYAVAPPLADPIAGTGHRQVAVQAITLGGTSADANATYGGATEVRSVSPGHALATGGATVTLKGKGFDNSVNVNFVNPTFGQITRILAYRVVNDGTIELTAPSTSPGDDEIVVCGVAGSCNLGATRGLPTFEFYEPGAPAVSSSSPSAGPAAGGSFVAISGVNLTGPVAVYFGATKSPQIEGFQQGGGDAYRFYAEAPPGVAGTTVRIRVATAESVATGGGPTRPVARASFTYRPSAPSAPRHLAVRAGDGRATVTWRAPASDGGSPVTGYELAAQPVQQSGSGNCIVIGNTVICGYPSSPGGLARRSPALQRVAAAVQAGSVPAPPPTSGPAPKPAVTLAVGPGVRRATIPVLEAGWSYDLSVTAMSARGSSTPADVSRAATIHPGENGYLVVGGAGAIRGFGSLERMPGMAGLPPSDLRDHASVAAVAVEPARTGYLVALSDGDVYGYGDTTALSANPELASDPSGSRVTGIAVTPSGDGYWLVRANGRVSAFGDAKFRGEPRLRSGRSARRIVAIAADPKGKGYWVLAANGEVEAFGAPSLGSLHAPATPAVGIAAVPGGGGYLVATAVRRRRGLRHRQASPSARPRGRRSGRRDLGDAGRPRLLRRARRWVGRHLRRRHLRRGERQPGDVDDRGGRHLVVILGGRSRFAQVPDGGLIA